MKRYPHGITEQAFFQKQAPKHLPSWIPTRQFRTWPREGGSRLVDFALVNSTEAVLFMVQNNCIDMNAWYSRVDKPDRPDFVLFDLDPPDDGFELAIEVAHLIRRASRRARASGLREDERRGRHPRRRADHPALDLPADLRLRREGVPPARATAPRQGHHRVAEEEARGRARRPPAERPRQDDRLRLFVRPKPGAPGVDAAALGGADPDVRPRDFGDEGRRSSGSRSTATSSRRCWRIRVRWRRRPRSWKG